MGVFLGYIQRLWRKVSGGEAAVGVGEGKAYSDATTAGSNVYALFNWIM
jgi:hypothetical protein